MLLDNSRPFTSNRPESLFSSYYLSCTSVMARVNPQSLNYTSAAISVSFLRFLLIPSKISHFSSVIIDSDKNLNFFVCFSWQSTSFLITNSSIFIGVFSRPPLSRSKNHLSILLVFVVTGFGYWVGVRNPERVHGGEQALRSWWPTRWGFCWRIFGFFSYFDSSGIVGV